VNILQGDAREVLPTLPDESVQCVVTSPPYWGLRDYGVEGQLGLEDTPAAYVSQMVAVFREVRRVLTADGTLWMNLGDSYSSTGGTGNQGKHGARCNRTHTQRNILGNTAESAGLKPKDLVGIPWRVAFALQADGWYLRQDIIWHKPNPMPESVTDRCTKAHEYLFLLTKSARYYYNAEAIKEPAVYGDHPRNGTDGYNYNVGGQPPQSGITAKRRKPAGWDTGKGSHGTIHREGRAKVVEYAEQNSATRNATRNKRSVWTIGTEAFAEAHFATFPKALVSPCILAGSRPCDLILDPFGGSGTVGEVALGLGRSATLIELNPEYVAMIRRRTSTTLGLHLA